MNGNSNEPVRDSDRIRFHEPVTIRYYGVAKLSLPTYLIMSLAGYILILLLMVGCNEIMQPQTVFGSRTRQLLARDGWPLVFLPWAPVFLIGTLIIETLEVAVVIHLFRRRFQQLRNEPGTTA
jgi:hypothetical protein